MNRKVDDELPYELGNIANLTSVWFTLTNRCNIYCTYCFNYIHCNNEDMPAALAEEMLDCIVKTKENNQLPWTPLHITLFGGEPTINAPALFSLIDYVKKNKKIFYLHLLTNGIIHRAVLEKLPHSILNYQISFDGFKGNLRQSKTGNDNIILHTVDTIDYLVARKAFIILRATIHQQNVQHMDEIIEFAQQHGVKSVAFGPICLFGEVCKNNIAQPAVEEYLKNLDKAKTLAEKFHINIRTNENTYQLESDKKTNEKRSMPLIWLPDGSLAMTVTYSSSKSPGAEAIIIGNYDSQTKKIRLNHEKIQQMNNNFLLHRKNHCSNCKAASLCKGMNNFSAYTTNSYVAEREEYFCNVLRKNIGI